MIVLLSFFVSHNSFIRQFCSVDTSARSSADRYFWLIIEVSYHVI